jgi:hypothetical protein
MILPEHAEGETDEFQLKVYIAHLPPISLTEVVLTVGLLCNRITLSALQNYFFLGTSSQMFEGCDNSTATPLSVEVGSETA